MTIEQVKKNIQYGDYNILQLLLKASSVAAARQRFLRGDEDALKAMITIQENRKELIEQYQTKNENVKQK